MLVNSLSGKWELRQLNQENCLEADVPGEVHLDLMRAGAIPDPFVGDNENRIQWVAEKDWEYRRTFIIEDALINHEHIELVCDGLDTIAEISINGTPIASRDNMFCQQRLPVKHLLTPGENEIRVILRSPVNFVRRKMAERPLPGVGDWIAGWQYLRKTASHFGWDWGPKLVTLGICKDIRIEGWSMARIRDVFVRQHHYAGKVTLGFMVYPELKLPKNLTAHVKITSPDGKNQETHLLMPMGRSEVLPVYIDHPQLWWPNGYGSQPLYQVEVILLDGKTVLDERKFQIGLRTLDLQQVEDPWGSTLR